MKNGDFKAHLLREILGFRASQSKKTWTGNDYCHDYQSSDDHSYFGICSYRGIDKERHEKWFEEENHRKHGFEYTLLPLPSSKEYTSVNVNHDFDLKFSEKVKEISNKNAFPDMYKIYYREIWRFSRYSTRSDEGKSLSDRFSLYDRGSYKKKNSRESGTN